MFPCFVRKTHVALLYIVEQGEDNVYVRPGGGKETKVWAEEEMRVIWEVPRSAIVDKVIYGFGYTKGRNYCCCVVRMCPDPEWLLS